MGPWTVRWPPRWRTASTSAPTPGWRSKRRGVSKVRYAVSSPPAGTFAVKESFGARRRRRGAAHGGVPGGLPRRRRPVPAAAARRRRPLPRRDRRARRSGCRPGPTSTTPTRCSTPRLVGTAVARLHAVTCRPPSPRTGGAPSRSGATEWRALVKAAKGAGAPFAATAGRARPRPAGDGGAADADGRRPVVPPRPVGRQPARHPRRRGCVIDFDNAGPGGPDPRAGDGAVRVRADRRRDAAARAGGGVRGGRRPRPRHPRRGLRADRRPAAPHRALPGPRLAATPATPRRGPGRTPASRSSSATRSAAATSSGCWAG